MDQLGRESLFMDEIRQVSYYGNTPVQIIADAASQQQPPLDYWLGHLVFKFSNSDFAARLPAALFGIGSVLLLVLLTRRVCEWPFALLAGLLMALSPFHIYYSQEARPYSIALFFLLALILILDHIRRNRVLGSGQGVMLFGITLLFLCSRTLFPLCVFAACFLYCLRPVLSGIKGNNPERTQLHFDIKVLAVLLLAFVVYLPILVNILSTSGSYLDKQGSEALGVLAALQNISLLPLWRSFSAQFEPVAIPVLLAGCAAFPLAIKMAEGRKRQSLALVLFLAVVIPVLNISVFSLGSSSEFRPPYAIYLLPLWLVLALFTCESAWKWLQADRGRILPKLLFALSGLVIVVLMTAAALESRGIQKKTDWRALSAYVRSNLDNNHLLLFDSLSNISEWKPYFYGFLRYTYGGMSSSPVRSLTSGVNRTLDLAHQPVLILFQYRDYRLTRSSRYPIMSRPEHSVTTDLSILRDSPQLQSVEFTGLSIHMLKESSGHFLADSHRLLRTVSQLVEESPMLLDIYLALAAMAAVCDGQGKRYDEYISLIQSVSRDTDRGTVRELLQIVEEHRKSALAGGEKSCQP